MGNVHMEARQVNYRGGDKPMSVEDAIKEAGSGYTLPAATAETLGGIKAGDNLEIEEDGTLNAPAATDETLGVIKVGDNLTIEEDGTLNAPDPYGGFIYSTTPVIIGKWINDENVKMRVYSFDPALEVSNSTWTSTGLTLANAKILKCFGVNNDNTCVPLLGSIDTNNNISLLCGRTTYGATVNELIIEYAESEE